MKVTLKSKLIGDASYLISPDNREFYSHVWHIRQKGDFKRYFCKKKSAPNMPSNTVINIFYFL